MLEARICLLVALVIATTSVTSAEDYILPTGVTVLTEQQLFNQLFGSTTYNGRWSDFCEYPGGKQTEVSLRAKHKKYGQYVGRCIIKGHLFCWEPDTPPMSDFENCYTLALNGDTITTYTADGNEYVSRWGRIKLIAGNPENL